VDAAYVDTSALVAIAFSEPGADLLAAQLARALGFWLLEPGEAKHPGP